MRHRERSGKDSACLAILSLTIAEEKRFGRRIIMSQTTGLAYKATAQHSSIVYM